MNCLFPIPGGLSLAVASVVMLTSLGCVNPQPPVASEPEKAEVNSVAKSAEPPEPPPPPPKSVANLVEELQNADPGLAFGIVKELGDRGSEAKGAVDALTQKLLATSSELATGIATRAAAREWRVLVFEKNGFESTSKWRQPTREDIGRGARIIGKNEVILQREVQGYRFVREEAPDTSELDQEVQRLTQLRDALASAVEQIGPVRIDESGEDPGTNGNVSPPESAPANESVVHQDEAESEEIREGDTPKKVITPTDTPSNEVRQWTDITGEFKVLGTFQRVSEDGKSVTLTREDSGNAITILFEKLSEADRAWVSQQE